MFDDGFDTQILKNHGDARICGVHRLVKERRLEGYDKLAALSVAENYNDTFNSPKLSESEVTILVDRLYETKLTFRDLERNKKVLELVRKFRSQGIMDSDILLEKVKLLNSNCNMPPLSDEELNWIIKNNAIAIEKIPYWGYQKPKVIIGSEEKSSNTKD